MPRCIAELPRQNRMLLLLAGFLALLSACSTISSSPTPTPIITDPGSSECQQAVQVVVWGDLDRDGVQDPDEPPVPDALLKIAPDEDPVNEGVQLSTSSDGQAYFPTRELENCSPAGHSLLFLRQVEGYAFPEAPVVSLDNFVPMSDVARFGLVPLADNE